MNFLFTQRSAAANILENISSLPINSTRESSKAFIGQVNTDNIYYMTVYIVTLVMHACVVLAYSVLVRYIASSASRNIYDTSLSTKVSFTVHG
jgi:hypothetical protein